MVTGAASGIGRALSIHLAEREGMEVVLVDVDPQVHHVADELRASGRRVTARETDISSNSAVEALAKHTVARHAGLHLLCNVAAVGGPARMSTLSLADWRWTLGVNLWGVVHLQHHFLPILLEQDEGHIVNTASVAPFMAKPYMGPYRASKAAIVTLTETLYLELAAEQSSVGVSLLCPGPTATALADDERNAPQELTRRDSLDDSPEVESHRQELRERMRHGMPPEEVAATTVEAIREPRLYILPYRGSNDLMRRRLDRILAERDPPLDETDDLPLPE